MATHQMQKARGQPLKMAGPRVVSDGIPSK